MRTLGLVFGVFIFGFTVLAWAVIFLDLSGDALLHLSHAIGHRFWVLWNGAVKFGADIFYGFAALKPAEAESLFYSTARTQLVIAIIAAVIVVGLLAAFLHDKPIVHGAPRRLVSRAFTYLPLAILMALVVFMLIFVLDSSFIGRQQYFDL